MINKIIDIIQGKPAVGRHKDWRRVRREHLAKHPTCACCGGTKRLQVHHIQPVHLVKDHELNPDNLLTLCRAKRYGIDCHLLIGHAGNFRKVMRYPQLVIDDLRVHGFTGDRR